MTVQVDPKRIDTFNAIREPGELDLADIIYKFLIREINQDAANIFSSDPAIVDILPKKPVVQKVIINNYFVNLLFTYRACGGEDITSLLSLLSTDTTVDGYVFLFTTYVLPFLKINNVYGIYKKEQ